MLKHLIQAEEENRGLRSIRYQLHSARFPLHRDLTGFDFAIATVDLALIEQLATLDFTRRAENVVLIGGTGTGKTHLATALGIAAVTRHGKRVRFYSTIELVNALEHEKTLGKAVRLAGQILRCKAPGGDLLQLALCERNSTALKQTPRSYDRGV
jgi:DNA replication protein DnaC